MRSFVSATIAGVLLAVSVTAGAQSSNTAALFREAALREAALRRDLTTSRPSTAIPILRRLRTLVGAYQDLARLFPTSGQADKALWQGANLSADAFWQYGFDVDRATALQLIDTLTTTFASSPLLAQASPLAKRLAAAAPTAAATALPGPARDLRNAPATPAADPPQPPPGAAPAAAGAVRDRVQPSAASAPSAPAAAPSTSPASQAVFLTAVRKERLPDAARITLELDREVPFHSERIEGPARVFIDLQTARATEALKNAVIPYADDVVTRVRIGQHTGHTRVVLDLEGTGRHSVYALYDPYRIVIDVERRPSASLAAGLSAAAAESRPVPAPPAAATATANTASSRVAAAPVRAVAPPRGATADVQAAVLLASSQPASRAPDPGADAAPPPAAPRDLPPPVAPAVNVKGGFSLSRQLGLGIARIVIDAGHGGHDPGAKVRGLTEADLVLDIALRLETLLLKQPGVEVIQTRRTNTFVSLEERTEIANRSGADLFLSIHANASASERLRGVETYFLNFAPNAEAEAIAARENAGSARQMRQLPDIVKAIALNNKIDESRDFATMVQDALASQVRKTDRRVKDLGVKQAPFMVLVGAAMPSILTEVSFVTNTQDASLLATESYRQRIAEALLAGVTRYQQALKKAPSVATQ